MSLSPKRKCSYPCMGNSAPWCMVSRSLKSQPPPQNGTLIKFRRFNRARAPVCPADRDAQNAECATGRICVMHAIRPKMSREKLTRKRARPDIRSRKKNARMRRKTTGEKIVLGLKICPHRPRRRIDLIPRIQRVKEFCPLPPNFFPSSAPQTKGCHVQWR